MRSLRKVWYAIRGIFCGCTRCIHGVGVAAPWHYAADRYDEE